ncbi:hypothetical protein NMY22_g10873 [Coprinellus aureogranulatus]|nr:hypothetical protein NMY22_g10873 [Coprinellus aureogranulatus]
MQRPRTTTSGNLLLPILIRLHWWVRLLCHLQEAQREVNQQKKDESAARKLTKAAERQRLKLARAQAGYIFSGALSSKKKDELEDIADDLGIEKTGKKDDIYARLLSYFNENPSRKQEARFRELFPQRGGRQRNNENAAPSSSALPTSYTALAGTANGASASSSSAVSQSLPMSRTAPRLPGTDILTTSNVPNMIYPPYPTYTTPFNPALHIPPNSSFPDPPQYYHTYQHSATHGPGPSAPIRAPAHTFTTSHSFAPSPSRFPPNR